MSRNPPPLVIQSLAIAARGLRVDFEQTGLFNHNASKGTERERLVAELLQRHLPGHIAVFHNAEIISVDGARSGQCDIVLADRSTPPLLDTGTNRLIPAECVYAVIEVKPQLDSKELVSACEGIKKAKALPKTAYVSAGVTRTHAAHGKTYPYVPTVGLIFAFTGASLGTLGNTFGAWVTENGVEQVPDSVWILGSGFINWRRADGRIAIRQETTHDFETYLPYRDNDILVSFLLQLNALLAAARMNPFDLLAYAGSYTLAIADRLWTAHESANDMDGRIDPPAAHS